MSGWLGRLACEVRRVGAAWPRSWQSAEAPIEIAAALEHQKRTGLRIASQSLVNSDGHTRIAFPAPAVLFPDVKVITSISDLPTGTAVYAMYGGDERPDVAYVGMGEKLRQRIRQHLVLRDSSATSDSGAVRLHPDHVSAVAWWVHAAFADELALAAAELVAFDVLEPRMRSRGGITAAAQAKAAEEPFRAEMTAIFSASQRAAWS